MTTKLDLLNKFGSPEAVSEYYRGLQKKSNRTRDGKKAAQTLINNNGKNYFRELGRKGGQGGKSKK